MAEPEKAEHRQRHVITETYGEQPKESWFKKNVVAMLAILVVIGLAVLGLATGWGGIKTDLNANRVEILKVEAEIAKVNAKVDQHHNDSQIHMDSIKWGLLNSKIDDIRALIRAARKGN